MLLFSPKTYRWIFFGIIVLTPGLCAYPFNYYNWGWPLPALAIVFSGVFLYLVARYNTSRLLSFSEGLDIITRTYMQGIANLTLIYIFPALAYVYIIAIHNTLVGLKRGKEYTQKAWTRLVKEYQLMHYR